MGPIDGACIACNGIRHVGPPRGKIWYFAYGAMHDSAFRQWRGMCPREWAPRGGSGDTGCVSTSTGLQGDLGEEREVCLRLVFRAIAPTIAPAPLAGARAKDNSGNRQAAGRA